jgi:hypothetical protein
MKMISRLGWIISLAVWVYLNTSVGLAQDRSLVRLAAPTGPSPKASSGLPFGDVFPIAQESVDTKYPAVAYNNQRQEYLVVWGNDRPGCDDIYGQRVSKSGTLAGPRFSIAAGCPDERHYPAAAYNTQQDEYLVVWEENGLDILGQRLSATGVLQGGTVNIILNDITSSYSVPSISYASTSDKYLIIFDRWVGSTYGIQDRAFQSDGTPDDVPFDVEPSISNPFLDFAPKLAYNRLRNEFLVVWEDYSSMTQVNIRGRRVKMAGGAACQGTSFWISSNTGTDQWPAVAAVPRPPDGQYLVTWLREITSASAEIWVQHVFGDGALEGGSLSISSSPVSKSWPVVAGNDSNQQYLVTWAEYDAASPYHSSIHGLMVFPNSFAPMAAPIIGGIFADDPAVAPGPKGEFLIVSDDPGVGTTHRIWGRFWGNRVYLPLILR